MLKRSQPVKYNILWRAIWWYLNHKIKQYDWVSHAQSSDDHISGGAYCVIVTDRGNGHGNQSSILDEAVCISHSTKILGKSMNPIILPPTIG